MTNKGLVLWRKTSRLNGVNIERLFFIPVFYSFARKEISQFNQRHLQFSEALLSQKKIFFLNVNYLSSVFCIFIATSLLHLYCYISFASLLPHLFCIFIATSFLHLYCHIFSLKNLCSKQIFGKLKVYFYGFALACCGACIRKSSRLGVI